MRFNQFSRGVLSAILVLALVPLWAAAEDTDALAKQVTIRRTEYGVPHIIAENYRALGFGFAYAQAEDHLHNIMRLMLTARGELARNFGPGAKNENTESDFTNLKFRYHARAEETYAKLGQDMRDILEGYAAGLNFYIAQHRAGLEDWIQPVTPQDVAAHGLAGVARFAFDRSNLIKKFTDAMSKGANTVVEPEPASLGSNLWAFDGTRTASGKAILMGNPHQPWAPVSTYYEAHATIPGKYNIYGSTYIGRPIITSGFNDNLGWTHTVNYPDLEEIYALDLDPAHPDHYLFDGASVPMSREEISVFVHEVVQVEEPIVAELHNDAVPQTAGRVLSGAPAVPAPVVRSFETPREREVKRTFWYTPLGPVIYRNEEQVFVLKSVTWDQFQAYEEWLQLGHAKNFAEFRHILDNPRIPMFNIGYADRDGNIFYQWYGTVPKLPHDNHEAVAVHARGAADVWSAIHASAELPQLLNPKGGYVMNSNSPPYFTNLAAPIDRSAFPRYFNDNALSLRSQHSLLLIHNDKKFSLEDVVKLKFDQRCVLADRVRDDLVRIVRNTQPAGDLRDAMEIIAAWDGATARESRGGVLFEHWWRLYTKNLDGRADPLGAVDFAQRWLSSDPISTPRGLRDEDKALATFKQAVAEVKKRDGALDAKWGDVHRLRLADGTDLPVGGSTNGMGSFRILEYKDGPDGKRVANSGDSWVFAVEFADRPRAYSVVAYGESEYPKSPHMGDQAPLFANEEMKPVRFSEEDIKANLKTAYHPGEEKTEDGGKTD
jgi:acyl-homoserine-lactone acylase